MKGLWVWPEDQKNQEALIDKIPSSRFIPIILSALAKNTDGLSNAQIDSLLKNNSQWNTRWALNEMLSLGLVEYRVDIFGGPGKYGITDLGRKILQKATAPPQPAKASAQHPKV